MSLLAMQLTRSLYWRPPRWTSGGCTPHVPRGLAVASPHFCDAVGCCRPWCTVVRGKEGKRVLQLPPGGWLLGSLRACACRAYGAQALAFALRPWPRPSILKSRFVVLVCRAAESALRRVLSQPGYCWPAFYMPVRFLSTN